MKKKKEKKWREGEAIATRQGPYRLSLEAGTLSVLNYSDEKTDTLEFAWRGTEDEFTQVAMKLRYQSFVQWR